MVIQTTVLKMVLMLSGMKMLMVILSIVILAVIVVDSLGMKMVQLWLQSLMVVRDGSRLVNIQ